MHGRKFGCDVGVRPPLQNLGEGEGSPKTTRRRVENAIFSWRKIARYSWSTGVFWREIAWPLSLFKSLACLGRRFSSTEVKFRTWEKISNIYKWKQSVQKNTQLTFWWKAKSSSYETCLRGLHFCCRSCCELIRLNEFTAFRSGPDAKYSRPSTLCFLCQQPCTHNPNTFSEEKHQHVHVDRHLVTGKEISSKN